MAETFDCCSPDWLQRAGNWAKRFQADVDLSVQPTSWCQFLLLNPARFVLDCVA